MVPNGGGIWRGDAGERLRLRLGQCKRRLAGPESGLWSGRSSCRNAMRKRTATLNAAALEVARAVGPIHFDETGKCDPFDAEKHLTSEYLKNKLGID